MRQDGEHVCWIMWLKMLDLVSVEAVTNYVDIDARIDKVLI